MIALFNSLAGTLTRKLAGANGCQVCLTNGGVEWIAETSRSTLQQLPPGGEVRIYTYLIHREDQFYLAGFASEAERAMFIDLLKVDGIGAKAALKILSAVSAERLAILLDSGDIDGLEALPGLGKKTAQKMVLALKGKLSLEEAGPAASGGASAGPDSDLVQALVAMGYDRKAAAEVVKRLAPELASVAPEKREQELLRRAIIELS